MVFFPCVFRFCSRTDCGCMYQLSVSLLNEKEEMLQEYKPDMVILDPDSDDCSWRQVRDPKSLTRLILS